METITTERGHVYRLTIAAYGALKAAKHAGEAETAFNQYAPGIPHCDRRDVWLQV